MTVSTLLFPWSRKPDLGCFISLLFPFALGCKVAHAELPKGCKDPLINAQQATLNARKFALPVTDRICYRDSSGAHIIYLTESSDRPFPDLPLSSKIEAHLYRLETTGVLVNEGAVVDASDEDEVGVRFLRSASEIQDIDGDGQADIILAYRFFNWTLGERKVDVSPYSGRMKLVIFHRGVKAAIRATTSGLDDGRETSASPAYFALPASVRAYLRTKMQRMHDTEAFVFSDLHDFIPVRSH